MRPGLIVVLALTVGVFLGPALLLALALVMSAIVGGM